MGTLNVATLNHSGTINVDNIRHSDGVTKHTNYTYVPMVGTTLLTGISWHTTFNSTTQTIADLSGYVDSDTIAVDITCYYMHNGSTNHGYLTGFLHQQGTNYAQTGTWFDRQHYDWYYNIDTMDYTVPWNGSGNTNLRLYVSNAYNTDAQNKYAFYLQGVHKQTS